MDNRIKAEVHLEYSEQKAFVRYMTKATRHKPGVWTILLYVGLPVICVAAGLALGRKPLEVLLYTAASMVFVLIAKLANREDTWYGFVYQQPMDLQIEIDQNKIRITTKNKKNETIIRDYGYDDVNDVFEQENAFYLFLDALKPFIIPKRCITEGTAEQLASLLREKLGERHQ